MRACDADSPCPTSETYALALDSQSRLDILNGSEVLAPGRGVLDIDGSAANRSSTGSTRLHGLARNGPSSGIQIMTFTKALCR